MNNNTLSLVASLFVDEHGALLLDTLTEISFFKAKGKVKL